MSKNCFPNEKELSISKILIIDDEQAHVKLLEWTLKRASFLNVKSLNDPTLAAVTFESFQPDLVLLDWNMPDRDGPTVIREFHDLLAPDDFVPILVLTGANTAETRKKALEAGAHDFLGKPLDYTEVMLRIKNLLQTRLLYRQTKELRAELAALSGNNKPFETLTTSTSSL